MTTRHDGLVLVRLSEGRGELAYIDPRPIPLGRDGHAWNHPTFPADWCFLCGATAGTKRAEGRCPEADEVERENAALAAYAARYAVADQPSV